MNASNWSDIIPHKSQQQQQDADPGSDKEMHPDSITQHTDSGHESSVSTPESPSTPEEECSVITAEQSSKKASDDKAATVASTITDTKIYKIRLQVPGIEPLDIRIGDTDICQELYHTILEKENTCHRTCFRIYYQDLPLDHFTEIKNIPDIKNNAVFRIVEEPYNIREARLHVRHLSNMCRCLDISDAVNGVECASFSCLPNVCNTHSSDDIKRILKSGDIRATDMDCAPPDYILPGVSNDVPLKPLLILPPENISNLCALKNITFSPFNPPPGPRKLKGDVIYVIVDTFEDRRFHLTCCTRGWYVNATIGDRFRPEPSPNHCNRIFHSLFDLLSDLSPHFKKTLAQILKVRSERHLFERLPTPYQTYSWIVPHVENLPDQFRADEYTQLNRIGLEDQMPGQIRDWNEELQTTHDMPQTNITERMSRDRARFKVYSDFVAASVRGALAVIDGSVQTINPMDEPRTHMYIWNNIFFSLGFDVKDHYKELGGDAAAHAAATADLNAIQAYTLIDDPKLHTLGMTVVDYKGYRVATQSIIPGILEREQEDSVVYGSFDSGKTIICSEEYEEILENSAKQLKIAPHSVWNGKEGDAGKHVKLYTSFESKGIIGNDRRKYLLDLLKTFPPDPNFSEHSKVTDFCKAQGFPRKYVHKLVHLRQELIESFVEFKTLETIKTKADLILEDIDIRLNPDCFSDALKHSSDEDITAQQNLVAEAAEFILTQQIPQFLRDCTNAAVAPMDGTSLTESLHGKGINLRYLGKVIEEIDKDSSKFDYLLTIAKIELVSRCSRHLFGSYIQAVESHCLAASIAHFLNLLVGSGAHYTSTNILATSSTEPEMPSKKYKKKRKTFNNNEFVSSASSPTHKTNAWSKLTQCDLWRQINEDAISHYGIGVPCNSSDSFIEWSGGKRLAMLRRFCILTGIQLVLKNVFKQKSHMPFTEGDICNLNPIVKHLNPRSQAAYNVYLSALIKMQQGFPRIGYELMFQAQGMMSSIYGPLHPDITLCYRLMARMAFAMGDYQDSLSQQHRALMISERYYGIDHCETIVDYINLAHFSFANLFIPSSLKLLYRTRYLLLVAHGENHPFMAQIDANIGVILYSIQEYETALKFLEHALTLYQKYDVTFCLKTALLYHVIARTHSCRGDFRTALQMEKEAFGIYSRIFGKDHEKTMLSSECLKHLTAQAVNFQKHMNEASRKVNTSEKGLAHLISMNVQPPSVQNIVELLNGFNNFIFWKIQIQTTE